MNIGFEAKILMGNYKDIQRERIETFNRIIGFIKDKIAPRIESQKLNESSKKSASHPNDEANRDCASHASNEANGRFAFSLPDDLAYLGWGQDILKRLHDGGANNYKFVVEKIAAGKIKCPSDIADLVWFYTTMYNTEREIYNRLDALTKEHPFRRLYLDNIKAVGAVAATGIMAWLAPLSRFSNPSKLYRYTGWGMDAICQKCGKMWFSAEQKQKWIERLKSQKKDPDKYICNCAEPDIVYEPQKKRKGMLITYNPQIKDFFYVIADNFIRNKNRGSYYGKKYDGLKAEAKQKHPDWNEGRARRYAIRKIIREFLTHIWMAWFYIMEKREPPVNPYVIDRLKHADLTYPVVDVVRPPMEIKSVDDVGALYEIRGEVESRHRRKRI